MPAAPTDRRPDRRPRRRAVGAALGAAVLVLAGCTSATSATSAAPGTAGTPGTSGTAAAGPTTTSPQPAATALPTDDVVVTVPPVGAAPATGTGSGAFSTASTPTVTTPTTPPVAWTLQPAPAAADVAPLAPVTVGVADGTLRAVTLTNPEGAVVPGTPGADGVSWTSTEKLGYGRTYTVSAEAVDAAGAVATQQYSFTTLTPGVKAAASFFPRDGMTVGVGQPVAVTFDEPVTDKAAVEAVTTVTTTPAVEGAFYWLSDTELHWRPRDFWPSNTTVVVAAAIYGRDLGGGVYGQEDRTATFTIGQTKVAVVDDATHTMTVTVDGVVVKQMPVSLGRDKYPTYNGVHVVAEKYETKVMDSSTWGLTGADAYRTEVAWATRISSSGEFVHAAPWSVDSQGQENVSHGCVNVSTENARWFHDNFSFGDVVDIRGTVGPPLQVWDGFGDWQVPWETYVQGGARAS